LSLAAERSATMPTVTSRTIHLLDNSRALSDAICEALVAGHADAPFDFARTMVLVPGGRLARAIERNLLARAKAAGIPLIAPSIVTPLMFAGRFVVPKKPLLSRLGSRLAWRAALDELMSEGSADAVAVAQLLHGKNDLPRRARARTAQRLEKFASEIASSMHDLDSIIALLEAGSPAVPRVKTLQALARRRAKSLEDAGCADRDDAIRDAIRAQDLSTDGFDRVIVLFADPEPAHRALLDALASKGVRVEVCVHTRESIDAQGFPIAASWESRRFPTTLLAGESIHVAESPADAAEKVVAAIRALPTPRKSDDIAVMAPDEESGRAIDHALHVSGSCAASAESRVFAATRLGTLLVRLSTLVGERSMESLAAFVRHPDVARALGFDRLGCSPDGVIAHYRAETISERWDDPTIADVRRSAAFKSIRDAVSKIAAPFEGERPASEWAPTIREALESIVGANLEGAFASERVRSVRSLDRALAELHSVPSSSVPRLTAAEAIDEVVAALRRDEIRGDRSEQGVTVLRWLDAGIADERHLVLAGFTDGLVPEGAVIDPILGDAERRTLGMQSSLRRAARDAWILDGILMRASARPGATVSFVVPRRAGDGEPQRPSRFLLRVPRAELPARVERLFPKQGDALPSDETLPNAGAQVLTIRPTIEPGTFTSVSVTAFRTYLQCPYLFLLRNDPRLRLNYDDEFARELAPSAFGTLLHAAVEEWAREEIAANRREESVEKIRAGLFGHLDAVVRSRFSASRSAAVRVQVELVRRRLERFAILQSEQAKEGWRIRGVELSFAEHPREREFAAPSLLEPVNVEPLDVENGAAAAPRRGLRLIGRIDRIDRNDGTGEWRALDYKTSADAKSPASMHLKSDGSWKDLQLPLYATLLRSLPADAFGERVSVAPSGLGYINLAPHAEKSEFAFLKCTDEQMQVAEEVASQVIGSILAGKFEPNAKAPIKKGDPFAAIWGLGLRGAGGDHSGGIDSEGGDE
jgi:RecB family exonuclease